MAKTLTEFTALTSAATDDVFAVHDITGSETKKITLANLIASILANQLDSPRLNENVAMTTTATILNALAGVFGYDKFQRSLFTYNGGTTAYTVLIGPGSYMCKDKIAYWAGDLTSDELGDDVAAVADTWYYLYIDYSAITSATALTDGSAELIWSDTAPTWNDTYRQWMNGDDRCIFAALTNSTPDDFVLFYHDGGDLVLFDRYWTNRAKADLDTTPAAVILTAPGFCTKALITVQVDASTNNDKSTLQYRVTGSATTTGHRLAICQDEEAADAISQATVFCDSSQSIDVWMSISGAHEAGIYTDGFFFPRGI